MKTQRKIAAIGLLTSLVVIIIALIVTPEITVVTPETTTEIVNSILGLCVLFVVGFAIYAAVLLLVDNRE